MTTARAGKLEVTIGANTRDFNRGITDAAGRIRQMETAGGRLGASMTRMGERIARAARRAATAFAASATVIAGATALMVQRTLANIDAQEKLAARLDGTIDGLRGLQIAAGDAGVETGTLNGAIERLNRRIGEAQSGSASAQEAIARLGVSAAQLAGMDVDQRVALIADRIQEMGLNSGETAAMLRDLGIRSTEMVNLFLQGGDAIRAARQEVDDFGLSVSALEVARIEAFNDSFQRLGFFTEGLRTQFTAGLSPALTAIVDTLSDLSGEFRNWSDVARLAAIEATDWFLTFVEVVENVQLGLARTLLALRALGSARAREAAKLGQELTEAQRHSIQLYEDTKLWVDEMARGVRVSDRLRENLERARNAPPPPARLTIGGGMTGAGGEPEAVAARAAEVTDRLAEAEARREEIAKEALQRRLDGLFAGMRNEEEALLASYVNRQSLADEALENELLTQAEHYELRRALYDEHTEAMAAIAQRDADQRLRIAEAEQDEQFAMWSERLRAGQQFFGNLAAAAQAGGEKMFKVSQALSIVQATMAGIEAGMHAWKWGMNLGGPPLAAAFAGASAAATAAQIASIASLSPGSKGGGGGVSTGVSGGGAASAAPERQVSQVMRIEGINPNSLFSGEQLIGVINEAQRQGYQLEVA